MGEQTRRGTGLLLAGGVLSALNGAAHFVLPVVYPSGGWAPHVEGLYEPVRWALYATTVFFGVLLVLGGALTVAVARGCRRPFPGRGLGGRRDGRVLGARGRLRGRRAVPDPRGAVGVARVLADRGGLYLAGGWLRLRGVP